jgi:hypothetical protein
MWAAKLEAIGQLDPETERLLIVIDEQQTDFEARVRQGDYDGWKGERNRTRQ